MFQKMRLRGSCVRGACGSIVWGYRTAATLRAWTVTRDATGGRGQWTLRATVDRVSPFELRQKGLHFATPRLGGFFVWEIVEPPRVVNQTLTAKLTPPLH
jgi:hypothetical protein